MGRPADHGDERLRGRREHCGRRLRRRGRWRRVRHRGESVGVSVVGKGRERGLQSIIAVDERLSNLENRLRLSFELELTQKLFVLVVRRSIAMRRVNGLAGGTSLPTSLSARARLTREIKSLRTHYNSLQVRCPKRGGELF